jgi:hypothetical protein
MVIEMLLNNDIKKKLFKWFYNFNKDNDVHYWKKKLIKI